MSAQIDFLRQVLKTAKEIEDRVVENRPSIVLSRVSTVATHPEPLQLKIPDFRVAFIEDDFPYDITPRLSNVFGHYASQLQKSYNAHFIEALRRLSLIPSKDSNLRSISEQLRHTFTELYNSKLEAWVENCKRISQERINSKKTPNAMIQSKIPSFNFSFLPALEAFFAKEQFPTPADKQYLAKHSGMSVRQIHVWFQNRRRRTRAAAAKAGQSTSISGEKTEAEEASDRTEFSRSLSRSTSCSSSATLIGETVNKLLQEHSGEQFSFEMPAPAYAFPAPYPPETKVDPFPCRQGAPLHLECNWERKPLSSYREVSTFVDVDHLISSFEKLRLHSPLSQPNFKEGQDSGDHGLAFQIPSNLTGRDVTAHYTIRPLPAPLPYLVRPSIAQGSVYFKNGSSQNSAFNSDKPSILSNDRSSGLMRMPKMKKTQSKAISALPIETNSKVKRSIKKVSGPPRRVPFGSPVKRKGVVQPERRVASSSSVAPSSPPQSTHLSPPEENIRLPSLGSDLDESVPSLSSSLSSSASQSPRTPAQQELELHLPDALTAPPLPPIFPSGDFPFTLTPTLDSLSKGQEHEQSSLLLDNLPRFNFDFSSLTDPLSALQPDLSAAPLWSADDPFATPSIDFFTSIPLL